jgi:hypothetical protein
LGSPVILMFLGDGPRDAAVVPRLVEKALGHPVQVDSKHWAHLRSPGHGYDRKLLFALIDAGERGVNGVVATVDVDRSAEGARLSHMRAARTRHRERHPPLPTALGAADPHSEAWLLDDAAAVRKVLKLNTKVSVPRVRPRLNAKATLDTLIAGSDRVGEQVTVVLGEIAGAVTVSQCPHACDTGLEAFIADVLQEIGPLVS